MQAKSLALVEQLRQGLRLVRSQPQALVYVLDAVPEGDGMANIVPLGESRKADHLRLEAKPENLQSYVAATVSVNSPRSFSPTSGFACRRLWSRSAFE